MSAGVSNSSGTEASKASSTGVRSGTSVQDINQGTTFDNTTTSQTKVPGWARSANRQLFDQRADGSRSAVDFLTGLLSDPQDSSAPQNRFSQSLQRLFDTNLTRARSGDAQSIGVGKQGQREGAAISDSQSAAIGQGAAAANSLLTNANPYQSLDFARLIAPNTQNATGTARTTGQNTTTSNEATSGTQNSNTSQQGSNSGYGITLCCFIFLQANRGDLPWYVRRCRDEFCSGRRVAGYRSMANWLVPWMAQSMLISSIVRALMIWPLTKFGGWLYDEPGNRRGWLVAPVVAFWFGLWAVMGDRKEKV